MAVLVLGGYGLIGQAIVRRLRDEGHEVIGIGRDVATARRRFPDVTWRGADLARLTTLESWAPLLEGVDAVVNAAGALQQSPRDDLQAVHASAIAALMVAAPAAGVRRVVQVSAVGAMSDAATAFMRTKAEGDEAVRASSLDWVILRPGLVISPVPYGGTALLRGLAAFPLVTPLVRADSPIQAVAVADVAEAVSASLDGRIPPGTALDLVEPTVRNLASVVALFRAWLGLPPAGTARLPGWVGAGIGLLADGLGLLGWRSPMRTTAMTVMAEGVGGDPAPARRLLGRDLAGLPEVLAAMPASVADLWFARLWLLKPLILGGLALFWLASGVIGGLGAEAAQAVLTQRGLGDGLAAALVWGGVVVDGALGLGLMVRGLAQGALLGMVGVTLAYVAGSVALTPDLWLDPLGPMVKTVPALILALVGLAVIEER